jgi:anti-sigma regulatory factor (Ser/Thr protein kinase)
MACNAPHWSHETTFPATLISASQARTFVSDHLVDHRLLYLVDPVRLVVSELATNALVHAQTAFKVSLAALDEIVLLTVRDDSRSVPVRRAAQAMDAGGRGLEIVDIISLDWGTDEDEVGSKEVWASFALRRHQEF